MIPTVDQVQRAEQLRLSIARIQQARAEISRLALGAFDGSGHALADLDSALEHLARIARQFDPALADPLPALADPLVRRADESGTYVPAPPVIADGSIVSRVASTSLPFERRTGTGS